jgi:glycosyltransferase involved in cell wall biosynthesis
MAIKIDKYLDISNATHLVIYDTWGVELTNKLKNRDIKIIMDMSSIPGKEIVKIVNKDISINGNNEFYKRFLRRYKKNYLRDFNEEISNCDYFLVPSMFSKSKLIEFGICENKIKLCPYGVNKLTDKTKNQLQVDKTNNNIEPITFLYVGRITPAKGIHYLLEGFKNIDSKKAKLICVGSKMGLDDYCKNTISNIQFTGFLNKSDLARIYEKADVYILPSLFEGMSLTIPEAMSMKLPVIVTKSSGADSLVENFFNGFLIDSMSSSAIENKVNWFIENRNKISKMGENAYVSIQNKTWKSYSDSIVKELSNI